MQIDIDYSKRYFVRYLQLWKNNSSRTHVKPYTESTNIPLYYVRISTYMKKYKIVIELLSFCL